MLSFIKRAAGAAAGAAAEAASQVTQVLQQTSLDNLRLEEESGTQLPPEYEALDLTYITKRVIAMGPPFPKGTLSETAALHHLQLVAKYLNTFHASRYMIWNLAEESYDYDLFQNQVLEFRCPGYPSPPLEMLFKICTSIQNWIDADPNNVAVVHCMTGRGRTAVVVACYLAWARQFGGSPLEALNHVCVARGSSMESVTMPSQRRYCQYFGSILDGVKPHAGPLVLRRVIINGVPDMAGDPANPGCRPYLQLIHQGKLLFSSTWAGETKFCPASETVIKFVVNTPVCGDVVMRCRHLRGNGDNATIFRTTFHTGFVPEFVLRLTPSTLDAVKQARFPPDSFVELIFAPVDTNAAPDGKDVEGAMHIVATPDKAAHAAAVDQANELWDEINKRKAVQIAKAEAAERAAEEEAVRASEADLAETVHAPANFSLVSTEDIGDDDDDDIATPGRVMASVKGPSTASNSAHGPSVPSAVPVAAAEDDEDDEAERAALERELGLHLQELDALIHSPGHESDTDEPTASAHAVAAAPVPDPVPAESAPVAAATAAEPEVDPRAAADAEIAEIESFLASLKS